MFWKMHDSLGGGMTLVKPSEAHGWNERGYGIFATINLFDGPRRIEHCIRIRSWSIDTDDGTKTEQRRRIEAAPLIPSSIVETKRGYHCHWYAEDGRKEFYRPLVSRMVAFFGADRNARDVARVLRVPGYMHMKNPNDPFLVKRVYGPYKLRRYTERQMFRAFPPIMDAPRKKHRAQRRSYVSPQGDSFWDRVYNLDQMEGLRRLSGTTYVNGENYEFRPVAGGSRHNIWVDDKSTSCWIDRQGRIGSHDHGGPTIVQWLAWFGRPKRECVEIVKELFPEIEQ